jgi:transposase
MVYRLENDKYFKLQGFKGFFRVNGLNQIPYNAEIANAHLLRKESGYYLSVTCFVPKEERVKTGKEIGLDFGIKSHVIDSEGNKYKWNFQESRRSKRLQKKISRTYKKGQKSSSNRNYRKHLNRLENEKLFNKKKDAINKFVSSLKRNYDLISIQDESIHAWHSSKRKGWGKSIQHSIMGGIISGIKKLPQTTVIDKWELTTQICLSCGKKTKHDLNQRVFECSYCGYVEDRDINSARVILKISKGLRNTMPVENLTNTGEYSYEYSKAS